MAFSWNEFDNQTFRNMEETRATRTEQDDEVMALLKSLATTSSLKEQTAGVTTGLKVEQLSMARTLTPSAEGEMNEDTMKKLVTGYEKDAAMASTMSAMLNSTIGLKNDAGGANEVINAINRSGVRDLVADSTDVLSKTTSTAPLNDSPADRNPVWTRDPGTLFEDFFEVCQNPNGAEVELLSRVTGMEEDEVRRWFEWKKNKVRSVFLARATVEQGPGAIAGALYTK